MKKQPKFGVLLQPHCFTLYSLMAFPFYFFFANLKTYELIYLLYLIVHELEYKKWIFGSSRWTKNCTKF